MGNGTSPESTIPKRITKARTEARVSPMPDNFGDAISARDFNQLLACLLGQIGR